MMHEHVLEAGGMGSITPRDQGRPTLVLLHGGSARWQSWEPLLGDFAATMHVFAPDLRGHGRSSWLASHYRLLDYTADIGFILTFDTAGEVLAGQEEPALASSRVKGDRPRENAGRSHGCSRSGSTPWSSASRFAQTGSRYQSCRARSQESSSPRCPSSVRSHV